MPVRPADRTVAGQRCGCPCPPRRATFSRVRASDFAVTTISFPIDLPDTVLARARRGELAALEVIYRQFERPAYTLALRLTAHREDAREVMHDAMLRMFERIAQFRADCSFWGWLRQIVVNEALMRLRRQRDVAIDDVGIDVDVDLVAGGQEPWQLLADRELENALSTLPALTRSVVWLYHVEGYTHAEIAELSGNTVSFSKSQLARGTQRLRRLLEALPEVVHG